MAVLHGPYWATPLALLAARLDVDCRDSFVTEGNSKSHLPRRLRRMTIQASDRLSDAGNLQTDALDRVYGLQTLRTDLCAVHDCSTAKQAIGIVVEISES